MNKKLFVGAKVKLSETGMLEYPELKAAEFMVMDQLDGDLWESEVTEDLMDDDSVGDVYEFESDDIELIDPNQTQDLQSIEMNFKSMGKSQATVDPLAKRDHKQLLLLGILS